MFFFVPHSRTILIFAMKFTIYYFPSFVKINLLKYLFISYGHDHSLYLFCGRHDLILHINFQTYIHFEITIIISSSSYILVGVMNHFFYNFTPPLIPC